MLLRSRINQITKDDDKLPSAFALKKLAETTVVNPDEGKLNRSIPIDYDLYTYIYILIIINYTN